MAISKRLRFEILRRDGHRCRSCGRTADEVKLTVDHVDATALGGSDKPENLQALCSDCNSGKSATPADAATVAEVDERAARWAGAVRAASAQMLQDIASRRADQDRFDRAWQAWTLGDGRHFPRPDTWRQSVDQWRSLGVPIEVVIECAEKAFANEKVPLSAVFKYMAKIVWARAAELQEAAHQALDEAAAETPHEDDPWPPSFWRGRTDMAEDILSAVGEGRSAAALAAVDADGESFGNDRKPDASTRAVEELLDELNALSSAIADLFARFPAEAKLCQQRAEAELNEGMGKDGWNSYDLARNALRHLGSHLGGRT